MPVTPNFTISQTDEYVIIDISVPHVRVTPESVEVALSEANRKLHWSSPPYLLVLTFEHAFSEAAEEACATYTPTIQNGIIQLQLAKAEPGVRWNDLDLVGKLVPTRQTPSTIKWLKEVTTDKGKSKDTEQENEDVFDIDGYGFFRMFRGVFSDWTRDGLAKEMFESPWHDAATSDDDSVTVRTKRRQERFKIEQEKFCADRYLQDMECQYDYIFMSAMAMEPHWISLSLDDQLQSLSLSDSTTETYFTQKEATQLASIPYPLLPSTLTDTQQGGLLLGLLDILFAYVYDHILTDGEPTVESAWTVSILSATFSWLEDWMEWETPLDSSVNSVVCSSVRRSLTYPYLRNLPLASTVWQHVSSIIQQGRRCVIRCLLQVRLILDHSELYYLNNKLFVDPYLAWLQRCDADIDIKLRALATQVKQTLMSNDALRDGVGLNLVEIELSLLGEGSDVQNESGTSSGSDESQASEADSVGCDDTTNPAHTNSLTDETLTSSKELPSLEIPKRVTLNSEKKAVIEVLDETTYDD